MAPMPVASPLFALAERVAALELPLRRWVLPDRFARVEVETSSRCNRACHYCPTGVDPRPDHRMEEALFLRILDELGAIGFRGRFSPHFFGEPLVDARLAGLLAHARRRIPRASIVVYTNGDALTPGKARELLDAGVDWFILTLEDGEPPAWRDTKATLGRRERRRFLVRDFDTMVRRPFNRGGTILFPGRELHRDACHLPATAVVVDAWGKVKLCANDYYGRHDWGDLHQETLMDVWRKPEFVETRKRLLRGEFERQTCRVCVGKEPASSPLKVNAG